MKAHAGNLLRQERIQQEQPALLDYRNLDWSTVGRTQFFCYQRFLYSYPGPIRNLRQRLIVTPPDCYGDQQVIDHRLTIVSHAALVQLRTDPFGNRVWELAVEHVEQDIAFEVSMLVERERPTPEILLSAAEVSCFFAPTPLTAADDDIAGIARQLKQETNDLEELAERISEWVAAAMRYGFGATAVGTTAAEALVAGVGLCQDYAHIMLAICRSAGLAARYVSGHMLAEGGSHAWVEVLLPRPDGDYRVVSFDPTNKRRPDLAYAIVAVGRDYRDVAPTSGSFTAPYSGKLSFTKRAGLTLVE